MRLFLLISLLLAELSSLAQGRNTFWLMGHDSWAGPPFAATHIDFSSGSRVVTLTQRPMNFSRTNTSICDADGNLLFYTNGIYIADRNHDPMPNGTGLNPSWITTDQATYGLNLFQGSLILPDPGDSANYYLFHCTLDSPDFQATRKLYLSTINMQLNNGLGEVTSKNQVLLQDELNPGKITAVKHANGRDWWVICHRINTSVYLRFLVTPDGITGPFEQQIGNNRPVDGGQVVFSPDGSRYAYYGNDGLNILDFNRCTGSFSNSLFTTVYDSLHDGGVAFSANSKVLYVTAEYFVYQFDLQAADVLGSKQLVATWDGFIDPIGGPFWTSFNKMQLAPDGKIYIGTGDGTQFLHTIHSPDNVGATCNLQQHDFQIGYYFNCLPNHPNYHLGALPDSPCDTLTNAVASEVKQVLVQLYPNPTNGDFTLTYTPQPEQGQLHIYDVLGILVHEEPIAAWSQLKRLNLNQLPQGVYHSRLVWKGKTGKVRFVKQ